MTPKELEKLAENDAKLLSNLDSSKQLIAAYILSPAKLRKIIKEEVLEDAILHLGLAQDRIQTAIAAKKREKELLEALRGLEDSFALDDKWGDEEPETKAKEKARAVLKAAS